MVDGSPIGNTLQMRQPKHMSSIPSRFSNVSQRTSQRPSADGTSFVGGIAGGIVVVCLGLLSLVPSAVQAGPLFSIDFQGPTIGTADVVDGRPITEADLLGSRPRLPAKGLLPSAGGFIEVDAISSGRDSRPSPLERKIHRWLFSVDEHAAGPEEGENALTLEAANGAARAAVGVFVARTGAGPVLPPVGDIGVNGIWPGLDGLKMPWVAEHAPTPKELPDAGDNLDALESDGSAGRIFFSLDASFPDPFEPVPANTGSAVANGFVGGDVLTADGGPARVYASAAQLGLDADGEAFDIDDLDALVVYDNGDGVYQPVTGPYSWIAGDTDTSKKQVTDLVLFSVRRGSALIGMPDALHGLPIEEGDILVPVLDACDEDPRVDGTDCDYDPGIFVAAEALGLATRRAGAPAADDLDALDLKVRTGVLLGTSR